jgi:hypothetical protein
MPDSAVLATCVHALQNDQHRAFTLGVQAFLERHDLLLVRQSQLAGMPPLQAVGLRRIDR